MNTATKNKKIKGAILIQSKRGTETALGINRNEKPMTALERHFKANRKELKRVQALVTEIEFAIFLEGMRAK